MRYILFCLFLFTGVNSWSQAGEARLAVPPLTSWKTVNGKLEMRKFMGREAIYLDKGIAYLPGSQFSNGELDVDIAPTNPGFGGLIFHMDSAFNYEEVYMRYIKSGWADAAQYSPVFNGESSWQLYPEYQGLLKYPANEWIHMKIKVQNKRAKVYFMGSDTAAIFIDSLRVPASSGMVGIWCLQGAYFSNLSFKDMPNEVLSGENKRLYNAKAVKKWEISPAVSFDFNDVAHFDLSAIKKINWKKAETEDDGLLNINRYACKKLFWSFQRQFRRACMATL